uniref:Uncharacterized protein n=1 Tax=Anguilla anguilla TaxID=7936 RepID=A0A0E9VFV2_ANGAN
MEINRDSIATPMLLGAGEGKLLQVS